MKKILAIVVCVILLCLSVVPAMAAGDRNDTHKDSYENYVGQGNLKVEKKQLLSFDTLDPIFNPSQYGGYIDTNNKKEGSGALAVDLSGNVGNYTVMELKNGAIDYSVTDRQKQTLKFWFYVNNIDLLKCDHDDVYETAQKGSGTIYFFIADKDSSQHAYRLQHTLEGNGWHLIEIAFATHNNVYEDFINMDLSHIGFMRVTLNGYTGLQVKFDDLQGYTYSNTGYTQPECPKNGTWVSTCDFDALDGPVLSEWYASSFDLKDKTQGSSSVSLTAHKEHVDTRAVWGGLDIPLRKGEDAFHYEIYISDLKLIGTDYQVRLSHCESGQTGTAVYSYNFNLANSCARSLETGDKGLHEGWNSVDIPLQLMKYDYDQSYYKNGIDFRLEHIVMFWAGASTTEDYTVKYDNMYIYKLSAEDIEQTESHTLGPKEEENTDEEGGIIKAIGDMLDVDDELALGILIGAIAFVVILVAAIVVIIILVTKKKKPVAPTPAPVKPAEEPKSETTDENK